MPRRNDVSHLAVESIDPRVFNRGGLDWDRPVFGRFGVFSGGMFGQLPVYCRAEGYEFGVIDKDTIADTDLVGTQILVLINSPKVWREAEQAPDRSRLRRPGRQPAGPGRPHRRLRPDARVQ